MIIGLDMVIIKARRLYDYMQGPRWKTGMGMGTGMGIRRFAAFLLIALYA